MASISPNEAVGLSVVAAVPGLFALFLPPVCVVDKEVERRDTIRRGEAVAASTSLLLGAVASAFSGKPWALLLTATLVGFLLWEYEKALKKGQA